MYNYQHYFVKLQGLEKDLASYHVYLNNVNAFCVCVCITLYVQPVVCWVGLFFHCLSTFLVCV